MTPLEKQLLVVRKLRQSLNEPRAYFYLSPVINSKVLLRKTNKCVLNPKERQQRN